MIENRKDCPMRHENGNCAVIGGFCTAVNDPICVGLHNAYDCGYCDGEIRAKQEREQEQDRNDYICKLKCTALMEEGMCSHGGLCCLYESQRTIEESTPLTLDELRKMEGQPVWMHTFSAVQKKTNVAQWAILETVGSANATFLRAGVNSRLTKWFCNYGERWLAYRRNPEEGEK